MFTKSTLIMIATLLGVASSTTAGYATTVIEENRTPIPFLLAEGTSPAQPLINSATGVWAAPIGHRQPTQKDLPSGTTRNEESGAAGSVVPDFGPFRSICRGC
jgi:hypothetical protein